MEKKTEKMKSEHPVIILIIFFLLLIPILILFGGKPYTWKVNQPLPQLGTDQNIPAPK